MRGMLRLEQQMGPKDGAHVIEPAANIDQPLAIALTTRFCPL